MYTDGRCDGSGNLFTVDDLVQWMTTPSGP
jgi:hypothetical protein